MVGFECVCTESVLQSLYTQIAEISFNFAQQKAKVWKQILNNLEQNEFESSVRTSGSRRQASCKVHSTKFKNFFEGKNGTL